MSAAAHSLRLDPVEQEAVLAEAEALLAAAGPGQAQGRYSALAQAAAEGTVEGPLLPALERLLEMSLDTGRARRLHGAEGEQTLVKLLSRTPHGQAAREAAQAVGEALSGLSGQVLEQVVVAVRRPGVYRIGIETETCRLSLQIDRHGLSVESLEV